MIETWHHKIQRSGYNGQVSYHRRIKAVRAGRCCYFSFSLEVYHNKSLMLSKVYRHTIPYSLRSVALVLLTPHKFADDHVCAVDHRKLKKNHDCEDIQWHDIHTEVDESRSVSVYNTDVCTRIRGKMDSHTNEAGLWVPSES